MLFQSLSWFFVPILHLDLLHFVITFVFFPSKMPLYLPPHQSVSATDYIRCVNLQETIKRKTGSQGFGECKHDLIVQNVKKMDLGHISTPKT